MSEANPKLDEVQQALEIFTHTRNTTLELRREMNDLDLDNWKKALTEELGRFAISNLDDAQHITRLDRSDKLDARIRRYSTALTSQMMLSETWSALVDARNEELKELLIGKTVVATMLPDVRVDRAFSLMYPGKKGTPPSHIHEVSGEVVYADVNLSELYLENDEAAQYDRTGSFSSTGWIVNVLSHEGDRLVNLRATE